MTGTRGSSTPAWAHARVPAHPALPPSARGTRRAARWVVRRWTLALGIAMVGLLCLAAAGAGALAPAPPNVQHMSETLRPPSGAHPLGTDEFGRDLLSRILFGARLTLTASAAAVALGALAGGALGLTAGYTGGVYDSIVGRVVDVLFAFPVILLGIAIVAVLGPGERGVVVAIAIASLPNFARVSRAAMLAEREREYVAAAYAAGASAARIVLRALLPNLVGPLAVLVSLGFAYAVLYEASLGFLGLGAQPPASEWGVMLSAAREYLFQSPWYSVFPGVAIFLLVFSLNLIGDGLRDLLDPRLR